jgi:hypothetical protein
MCVPENALCRTQIWEGHFHLFWQESRRESRSYGNYTQIYAAVEGSVSACFNVVNWPLAAVIRPKIANCVWPVDSSTSLCCVCKKAYLLSRYVGGRCITEFISVFSRTVTSAQYLDLVSHHFWVVRSDSSICMERTNSSSTCNAFRPLIRAQRLNRRHYYWSTPKIHPRNFIRHSSILHSNV